MSVDESSIKRHPLRQGGVGQGLPRRRRRQGMGRHQGGAANLRSTWSNAAPPFLDQAALLRSHPLGGAAQARSGRQASRRRRRCVQDRRPRDRSRISSGRSSRMPAWGRPARWSRSRTAVSPVGAARRKRISCRTGLAAILQMPRDNVRVIWTTGPGSYGRNDADDCAMDAAVLAKAVGRPVRVQYMRDQGTGWDPKAPASIHTGARRARCVGQRHRLGFPEQGFLPRRRRYQRQQAERHAGRADARRRAASRATASACRSNPTALPISAPPGRRSRRCSIALRRCARRICAIRSGRRSISPANRSWTKWRRR